MRVNLDARRAPARTLQAPRRASEACVRELACSVRWTLPDPVSDDAPVTPQASYGVQKAIAELLIYT